MRKTVINTKEEGREDQQKNIIDVQQKKKSLIIYTKLRYSHYKIIVHNFFQFSVFKSNL